MYCCCFGTIKFVFYLENVLVTSMPGLYLSGGTSHDTIELLLPSSFVHTGILEIKCDLVKSKAMLFINVNQESESKS